MPSHYLNQCWSIVNWIVGNKLKWNLNRNIYIFIQENAFENVIWEMAIMYRTQYGKVLDILLNLIIMMTSWQGIMFCNTVALWGESTNIHHQWWIPITERQWCGDIFFICLNKLLNKQSFYWWFDNMPMWYHSNVLQMSSWSTKYTYSLRKISLQ